MRNSKTHKAGVSVQVRSFSIVSDSLFRSDLPSFYRNLILNFYIMRNNESGVAHTPNVPARALAETLAENYLNYGTPEEAAKALEEFLEATLNLFFDSNPAGLYREQISAGRFIINELCQFLKTKEDKPAL